MKFPKFPLFSRRALTAAASVSVAAFAAATAVEAGTIRHDYAKTLYQDFATNSGMFAAGATNVQVYKTDGTIGGTIPLMPNLSGFICYSSGWGLGGAGLIAPQFIATATHVGTPQSRGFIRFYHGTSNALEYEAAGYTTHGYDQELIRLEKIVTEATYNQLATDSGFIRSLASGSVNVYRLGTGASYVMNENGGKYSSGSGVPLGGAHNVVAVQENSSTIGNYRLVARLGRDDPYPLGITAESGDSGSPVYAYNAATKQFEYVGAMSTAAGTSGYSSNGNNSEYNPTAYLEKLAFFDSDRVSLNEAGDAISWNGTNLSRGDETWDYHGLTNGSTTNEETRGIVFDNASTGTQEIRLTQAIDLGAGSVTVNSGSFLLSSEVAGTTSFKSAGFIVNAGATLTTTFSGASGTEWRKVGEGNLVIQGSGNHEIALNVGGGVQQFDENLNQLYLGEVRLDREGGYAAKTIRLSAGVAKIVLMRDGQIKNASSFSFGVGGGLLNLNGQNLNWNVINHTDSGAKFGNFKLDDATEAPADSTFTYTGSGTFKGGFIDGNGQKSVYDNETKTWTATGTGEGNLKVVYAASNASSTWTLTGTSKITSGVEVTSGTLVLQGSNTTHATYSDSGDWTYAILETPGGVTVNDGATFRLSHHALMTADVTVNAGVFEMTDTVKAASESISGGLREDVTGIRSLRGNVSLASADATMKANVVSKNVELRYDGVISGGGNFEKIGTGKAVLGGENTFTGTKTVTAGMIEFTGFDAMGDTTAEKWNITEGGALKITGMGVDADVLDKIRSDSSGVLALDADVAVAADLSGYQNLFIGAAEGKTINYGAENLELATNAADEWRLGGGGGTLNVLYKLTGENKTLIIGNEVSNGTVYLANANNDFSGSIVIGGFNNFLDYVSLSALGNATFQIQYGNAMNVLDGKSKMIAALSESSAGIATLSQDSSAAIDFSSKKIALGALVGETVRYTGTLTPHTDGYRFGGSGTLILDTQLSGSTDIFIDAQGMSGGQIIFAQENSGFTGAVTAGGKLETAPTLPDGSIVVGFENGKALANASSFTLKSGAVLDVGGADVELRNVTVESGSAIKNLGTERRTFTITYDGDKTWLNGTFGSGSTAAIDFVKKGAGTLSMGFNNAFVGTMTVAEGTVVGHISTDRYSTYTSFGGEGNRIVIDKDSTLKTTIYGTYRGNASNSGKNESWKNFTFANTRILSTVTGTGTLVLNAAQLTNFNSIGSSRMIMGISQSEQFEGTVKVSGQTRLIVGNNITGMSNAHALDKATIEVEAGSQVRVTNRLDNSNKNDVFQESYADYIISGTGFSAYDQTPNFGSGGVVGFAADYGKKAGALSVDCGSVVYGSVTLAADATIASHSSTQFTYNVSYTVYGYGAGDYYGGTIRGAILGGADKTLTLGGNESLTFQADAASDYGDLVIANGNGSLSDKFALRVNGGAYRSTTSTALGGGTVTLNAGLILRFGNTEKAGNDVVYTYGNAFSLGDGAALESNWNTTRLTGAVTLAGTSATLATRNGSALRLEGGLVGDSTKTANVAAGSLVALGGNAANAFAGTLATGAGTSLTLLDGAAAGGIASTAQIAFTDSLTLSLEGTRQFTLASIVGTADAAGSTALDLHYDFTSGMGGSSLSAGTLTSDALNVFIDLNSTETLTKGSYRLLSGGAADGLANYTLATRNDRLSLKLENGALVLTVDADGRLVWRRKDGNAAWDTTTVHWNSEKAGDVAFAAGDSVIFDETGVAADNSAANRESVTLASETTVGAVLVRDAFYTFSGAGKLSGENASLNVAANGSLRLETSGNAFAQGATVQDGGTLALAASGALTDTVLSLKSAGTLSLEASGALAGTTTVVFDGGTLRYGAGAAAGDVSAFLRAGTDAVKLDLNGNAGVALADLSALSPTNTATIALSNSAYDADAGTGAAGVTLGSASGAYETAAGSVLEIGAGVSATHFGKGTLGVLSGAGDYTFDGSAGALTVADMTGFTGTAAIVNASSTNKLIVTNKSAGTTWSVSGNWTGGNVNFNDFAASDATITLTGALNSWITQGQTYAQNFVLANGSAGYGVKLVDGSSGATTTFSGAFTGSGLFLVDRSSNASSVSDKIKFTGDLSGFAGGFESRAGTNGIAFSYIFSDDGGATTYADNDRALGTGGIKLAGTAELNFAAAHGVANAFSGAGAVTKTGAGELSISGDWSGYTGTLTVGEGAGGLTLSGANQHLAGTYAVADALRVTGTATFDAGAAVSFGSLSVAQGSSLSMSGGVTIAARAGAEAATLGGGATLSHGAIVGATTDDASSELADAVATFSGTREGGFALTNVALENTEVVARNSAALTLTDVALRDNSRLTVMATASATLAGAFASLGEISVESGGTLTIAGTANLFTIGTSEALPVLATTAGSVVFGDSMFLRLQSEDGSPDFGESDVTVQLFKVLEGATFSGDISAEKISWNGAALGERTTFSFDQNAGTLSFSGSSAYNLTWNGGTEGTWDKTNETAFTIDGTEGTRTRFYDRDAVTFATADARVTLGAAIDASAVAVQENLTLSADATNTFHADSVVIDAGKTLTLEDAATAEKAGAYSWEALTLADASSVLDLGAGSGAVSIENVWGSGSVKVAFSTDAAANSLSVGGAFTGTAEISAGAFDVTASDIGGGSYRLADGVNVQASATAHETANAFSFAGTHQFSVASDAAETLRGTFVVAENGLVEKTDAGALTLAGAVSGEVKVSEGTLAISGTLDGKATLSSGTLTISGSVKAGSEIVVDAGTLNFSTSATAFAGNLTLNGGALNFTGKRWEVQAGNEITLAGGSVTGSGDGSGTLDFSLDKTVNVRAKEGTTAENPTVSTIASTVCYRNNSTTTYDVEAGAKLVHAGNTKIGSAAGNIRKTGAGEMLISGSVSAGMTFTVDEGKATLTAASGTAKSFAANLVVNGGTFEVSNAGGQASDTLNFDGSSRITLNGGALNFVSSRWTIKSGIELTLAGASVTGTDDGNGTLDFFQNNVVTVSAKAGATAENPTVSTIAAAVRYRGGTTTFNIAENARLEQTAAAIYSSSASVTYQGAGSLKISSITANVAGTTTIALDSEIGSFGSNNGADFLQRAGKTTVTGTVRVHNRATTSQETFEISGGVMNLTRNATSNLVTATSNTDDPFNNAAIIVGNWGNANGANTSLLNISGSGVLNVEKSQIVMGFDSSGTLNVSGDAEVNARGVVLFGKKSASTTTVNLNGGRLNLGASGLIESETLWSNVRATHAVNLNGGTVGALESWSSNAAITLGGNVVFDTEKREISVDGKSTLATDASGNAVGVEIVLNGALGGASGALEKTGAGTLTLAAANSYGGGTTIAAGTLVAADAGALGTGAVKVASGAELRAGAAVSLTTAAQTLKLYVSDAQKGESGAALVTSADGGRVTVSGDAKVYVDISALTLAASAENSESVTLRIASETALMASEGTFEVGWWEGEAWRRFEGIYDYSADMGLLTVAIPEPSAFGLLAGLAALALAGTRRRKRR
ncbi:MAG: autotransporter-associated beta strand repeat-containing protein [Candidatus Spyradosoma sp.]